MHAPLEFLSLVPVQARMFGGEKHRVSKDLYCLALALFCTFSLIIPRKENTLFLGCFLKTSHWKGRPQKESKAVACRFAMRQNLSLQPMSPQPPAGLLPESCYKLAVSVFVYKIPRTSTLLILGLPVDVIGLCVFV